MFHGLLTVSAHVVAGTVENQHRLLAPTLIPADYRGAYELKQCVYYSLATTTLIDQSHPL
jgi:hypothetical protein